MQHAVAHSRARRRLMAGFWAHKGRECMMIFGENRHVCCTHCRVGCCQPQELETVSSQSWQAVTGKDTDSSPAAQED